MQQRNTTLSKDDNIPSANEVLESFQNPSGTEDLLLVSWALPTIL